MAKKVTVSIPDMLHEKMEKWRESFNLSKMFQEAVSEAIQKKEELQKRIREDLDLNQIIERLRTEKMHSEGNFFETGRKDGVRWAKAAHYEDLLYARGWQEFDNATRDRVLGDYFSQQVAAGRAMATAPDASNPHLRVYLEGWKSGVEQFWSEIRDKL